MIKQYINSVSMCRVLPIFFSIRFSTTGNHLETVNVIAYPCRSGLLDTIWVDVNEPDLCYQNVGV